jgi:choline dehydrogenase-like flavoprotein
MHASYANAGDRKLNRVPGMTIGVTQMRPQSRGSIHIRTPDPFTPPAIRPNFLSACIDQDALIGGMRIAREIVEQPAMDLYRAYKMTPPARASPPTSRGSISQGATARPSTTPSAPAGWAGGRKPWSTSG